MCQIMFICNIKIQTPTQRKIYKHLFDLTMAMYHPLIRE